MQAVILAAGRGERFGEITKTTAKPLLRVKGKTIIQHILENLPVEIKEVYIVVDHLAEQIESYVNGQSFNFEIKFIKQDQMRGTAGALWAVKDFLKEGFLVLNADDLQKREELEKFIRVGLCFGVKQMELPDARFFTVVLDKYQNILDLRRPQNEGEVKNALIATGVFVLDQRIFSYLPVPLPNKDNEYGLPQTIIKMASDLPVRAIFMKEWFPVNTPLDLERAQNHWQK